MSRESVTTEEATPVFGENTACGILIQAVEPKAPFDWKSDNGTIHWAENCHFTGASLESKITDQKECSQ